VTLPALAVKVTVCANATGVTLAVNAALVAFAGTVTVAGAVTAALLLARLTLRPPLPAAELNVNTQTSVPVPVIDPLLQDSALTAALTAVTAPFGLATDLSPENVPPSVLSFPVTVSTAAISNCIREPTSSPAVWGRPAPPPIGEACPVSFN
jgi:hypothetical protein